MPSLSVTARYNETKIEVRTHLLDDIGCLLRDDARLADVGTVAIITDDTVGALYADQTITAVRAAGFQASELRVTPGETSKSLDTLGRVYQFLAEHRIGRDGLILALGGGVVSDLAGFAAATWMRGIPFAICPTTLESAIDAAIGGKTAINTPGGKNLTGAFHQPVIVATDPTCLKTLNAREISAGMAESIKHGLITGDDFLTWQETHADAICNLDDDILTELILRNVQIKCAIVQRDPFEQTGERMFLNFGHTIGHAVESCCDYRLRHGECVALGMLTACRMSNAMGLLGQDTTDRTEQLLLRFNLPTKLHEPIPTSRIIEVMQSDKKAKGASLRFVLLEGVGKPVIRTDVPDTIIHTAIDSLSPE